MTSPTTSGAYAVITGASEGIGEAFARELASRRIDVVLVARRQHLLEALAAELTRMYGVQARVIAADLSTSKGVEEVITGTKELSVDTLIASAGFGTSGEFVGQQREREGVMVDLNCRAIVTLSHHFARRFVARRSGTIILMSSLVAFQGVPHAATYAATKAFVQSFAEALRVELRDHGVRVMACAPGPIRSGFGREANMDMGMSQTPDVVARSTLDAVRRGWFGTWRPGWLSSALEWSLKLLPRWGRVRMMGVIMSGMARGG